MRKQIHHAVKGTVLFFSLLLFFAACNSGDSKPGDKPADNGTDTTTYIRYNANSPEGQANMKAMADALKKMKQFPCDTTYSWYYQGAIHSVPDQVANGNPYCPSYTSMKDMKPAWMNCTHDPDGFSELHFLIWHRLYIWHFEQIIRKQSGKKDFTLPYWDYTDTAYRIMPAIFRDKNDSLYESARLASLNNGARIESFMNNNLDMTNDNENKLYSLFDAAIDAAPHGAMHNYIGGGYADDSALWNRIYQGPNYGLMAQVESAAFDPIFWVHHANIDYLWQKWDMSPNGSRPILDSLLTYPWAYVFFDADGRKVEYTIPQALEKAFSLDYRYDVLPAKLLKMTDAKKPVAENRQEIFSSDQKVPIRTSKQLLTVQLPAANKVALLKTQDLSRKVTILQVTVSFTQQPRSDYDVYIDTDKSSAAKLAGTMTFFGAMSMQKAAPEYFKTFKFDVSDEVDAKNIAGKLNVFIEKRGPGANEITIRNFTLETRDF
jgi:hypothetical protein